MNKYTPLLVQAISLAQHKGVSLQDFIMDVTLEWVDCIQGRKLEKLIRKGHSPKEAAEMVQHSTA
jgi:hypothetical protein